MKTEPRSSCVPDSESPRWQRLLLTVLVCVAATLVATPLLGYIDLANIVMLFLLVVLIIAVRLGRDAAILASILSVLLFDLFFVPPRFSLAVSNLQYLITFAVMLATALITTHLTAVLQQRAREAGQREARTQALYRLAQQLAGSLTVQHVAEVSHGFISEQLDALSTILLLDETGKCLQPALSGNEARAAAYPANAAQASGKRVRSDGALYLPLCTSMRVRGVLVVRFVCEPDDVGMETLSLLEAIASLLAVAFERLHYVDVAQATELKIQTERLRSSILSALSHDLRTPLTAMVGLADTLFLINPPLPEAALDTAQALREQSTHLAGLVGNLLEMARLHAGSVSLRREWQPIEEVIGASIKLLGSALSRHPVRIDLEPGLPLLEFDAVLIERVFCNLLENAAKYAPEDTGIAVQVQRCGAVVEISVCDHGPGFPANSHDELFELFVRGKKESDTPGVGLGLAICKAIVEVHGGRIGADNRVQGGACVRFTLPVGSPPMIEAEVI